MISATKAKTDGFETIAEHPEMLFTIENPLMIKYALAEQE
ncbi:MAG: hypothetical protein RL595_3266 [Planctomycetota bacterium]|jgi:hypothetical protein